MKAKTGTVALSAAVALLLAGCTGKTVAGHGEPVLAVAAGSGGSTASGSPTGGTTASAGSGRGHTTDELKSALLTINDLTGSGWSVEPDSDDSDDDSDDPTCDADDPGDDAHQAEVDFSQGTLGPFLFEQLYSAPSAAAAKAAYAKIASAIASCSGTTQSDGSSATISAMSFPKFGDQSSGYRLLETVPDESTSPGDDSVGQTFPADIVFVQDGALLEAYVYIDLTGSGVANLPGAVKNGVTRAHSLR
jgi:hypothetical protein